MAIRCCQRQAEACGGATHISWICACPNTPPRQEIPYRTVSPGMDCRTCPWPHARWRSGYDAVRFPRNLVLVPYVVDSAADL